MEIRHRVSEVERRQTANRCSIPFAMECLVTDTFNEIVMANEAAATDPGIRSRTGVDSSSQ